MDVKRDTHEGCVQSVKGDRRKFYTARQTTGIVRSNFLAKHMFMTLTLELRSYDTVVPKIVRIITFFFVFDNNIICYLSVFFTLN